MEHYTDKQFEDALKEIVKASDIDIYDNKRGKYINDDYFRDAPIYSNKHFRYTVECPIIDGIGLESTHGEEALVRLSPNVSEALELKGDRYNAYFYMPTYDGYEYGLGVIYMERYDSKGRTVMHSNDLYSLIAFWCTRSMVEKMATSMPIDESEGTTMPKFPRRSRLTLKMI